MYYIVTLCLDNKYKQNIYLMAENENEVIHKATNINYYNKNNISVTIDKIELCEEQA